MGQGTQAGAEAEPPGQCRVGGARPACPAGTQAKGFSVSRKPRRGPATQEASWGARPQTEAAARTLSDFIPNLLTREH